MAIVTTCESVCGKEIVLSLGDGELRPFIRGVDKALVFERSGLVLIEGDRRRRLFSELKFKSVFEGTERHTCLHASI